ncbi:MAG: ATP synthase F0 subunit B, partial [Nitrosopumilaceae archaeon]
MNIKFIFLSVLVLGLIVNTASFSDLAFGDKPDKEEKKGGSNQKKIQNIEAKAQREEIKTEREEIRAEAKAQREEIKTEREEIRAEAKAQREEIKIQKKEVEEFGDSVLVTSSSTTTICHIPPGNPANNHTITIGESALSAHLGHGDVLKACNYEPKSNSNEVEEFGDSVLVTSSSTTTICHIPPGNPANNHTITIGESALSA